MDRDETKKLRVFSAGKTDIGKRRKINQDAYFLDDERCFYVVADGMGGHAAGEVAAHEAVEAIHDMMVRGKPAIDQFRQNPISEQTSRDICRLLEMAVQSATYLVFGMAEQSPSYHGMGTTVSALLICNEYAVTAQVGDTRIYRIRDNDAMQLTEDHTLINWQIREGIITPEEAKYSPHRNVITRAVGNKEYVQVDTQIVSVAPGDRFLICSDGLHTYIKQDEIPKMVEDDPQTACEILIEAANARGGKDNITAVLVEIVG